MQRSQIFVQNRVFFCLLHLHSTPPLGGFPSEYRHPVGTEKLEWLGYPMVKKFGKYLYSFWHNSRTWRTDRHTDTAYRHRPCFCIAPRGKNWLQNWECWYIFCTNFCRTAFWRPSVIHTGGLVLNPLTTKPSSYLHIWRPQCNKLTTTQNKSLQESEQTIKLSMFIMTPIVLCTDRSKET